MQIIEKDLKELGFSVVDCSKCGEFSWRKTVGISPNRRRRYYKDENGRAWRGRLCPDCAKTNHTKYMRKHRAPSGSM